MEHAVYHVISWDASDVFLLIMAKVQKCLLLHTGKPYCILLMTSVQGKRQQLCILFNYAVNQVRTNRIEKHNDKMLKKPLKMSLVDKGCCCSI